MEWQHRKNADAAADIIIDIVEHSVQYVEKGDILGALYLSIRGL